MNDLGATIKFIRMTKKMSQPVLAERLGVTRSAIASYENGTRMPSYDILFKIAKLFRVTIDNLLGYDKKDVVDITSLIPQQKIIIRDIIQYFENYNRLSDIVFEGGPGNPDISEKAFNFAMETGIFSAPSDDETMDDETLDDEKK